MNLWSDLTATLWRLLDEHGQITVFVLLFLEEAGIPPLIPGDLLMMLVGARAAMGQTNLLEALAVLQLATVLGGSVLYWVAARGGQELVYRLGRHVGATPERLDQAAASLGRHGGRAVVLGRLLPGLSMITTIACGVLGYPYRRFLPALALGGFLRLLVFVIPGYLFGPPILELAAQLHLPFEMMTSVALFLGLSIWMARAARAESVQPPTDRHAGHRLHAGILAGLLGAIQSTLLVNSLIYWFGLLRYDAPGRALEASGLLGSTAAPTLLVLIGPAFVLVPTLLGGAYGVWGASALPGRSWLRGALFALGPLAVSLLVGLPLLGAGVFGVNLQAGPIPALGEALRFLTYGLVLGITYAALSRRAPRSLRRRAPQPA